MFQKRSKSQGFIYSYSGIWWVFRGLPLPPCQKALVLGTFVAASYINDASETCDNNVH
jgi:hypothetical protein